MASNKRCHYEVLGLSRDCTADEIRSAYKKLALQRHPDKLIQSGLTHEQATAQFQELSHAYEVLSDPKERAWYDSHRSQILFSDPTSADSVPDSVIPNLFSFFSNTVFSGYSDTGRGFYKVYSDVFNKIYANEVSYCGKLGFGLDGVREAPMMGNLEIVYAQVTAFYNYWLGFCTVMDFFWVDQYDVMAGPNRKSRRVMEEENKKLRKKAKREYNETVRGLAEFVKKRDKRVLDMMVKKNAEMERKKEEEKQRRKKLEKERMERLRAYEEPEWARVNEEEMDGMEGFEEEDKKKGNGGNELYCVVCGKKFKSEKQWKNHEQSKKHKEKVAELRESFQDEDEERYDFNKDAQDEYVDHNVEEIEERFKEDFKIREEGDVDGAEVLHSSNKKEGFVDDTDDDDGVSGVGEGDGNADKEDDEEISVLEAMLLGHKGGRNRGWRHVNLDFPQDVHIEDMKEESEAEYNNCKTRRRKGKKARGWNNGGGDVKSDIDESTSTNEENDKQKMESSSNCFVENGDDGNKSDDEVRLNQSTNKKGAKKKDGNKSDDEVRLNQSTNKKGAKKKETNVKSKNSSKARKGKATSKDSGNVCDTCGVEFESRNKLHKHLGDTGHATIKFR